MTPADELWAAVTKHCATGRGYRIEADTSRLWLFPQNGLPICVEPTMTGWRVFVSRDTIILNVRTADEAVSYATSLFAPSTEPNA